MVHINRCTREAQLPGLVTFEHQLTCFLWFSNWLLIIIKFSASVKWSDFQNFSYIFIRAENHYFLARSAASHNINSRIWAWKFSLKSIVKSFTRKSASVKRVREIWRYFPDYSILLSLVSHFKHDVGSKKNVYIKCIRMWVKKITVIPAQKINVDTLAGHLCRTSKYITKCSLQVESLFFYSSQTT